MKKLTSLMMLLIIAIGTSAKTTAYAPTERVGAGELEYGVNYIFYNTAYTPGTYPYRYGFIYYNGSVRTYGTQTLPSAFNTSDANYVFQITDANTLYSVGQGANVGTSYSFTAWEEASASDKSSASSRNDDGTFTAAADITASNKLWLVNNGSQYWNGNNWTSEGGNSFALWSNGHAIAIYKVEEVTTVDVTYILQETNGTEVNRTTVAQRAGSEVAVPASMQGNLFSVSTSGTIGNDDCQIIVTRTPNFDFSIDFTGLAVKNDATTTETTAITDGQWYVLTQVRDGETPAYDTGAGNVLKRAGSNVTISQGTDPATVSQYLVRFFDAGMGNAKYIQFGTGNFWNNVYSSSSNATTFLIYPATNSSAGYNGWAINKTTDGTSYENIVDNNGAGYTLAYWESGQVTTGTNNIWKLYPVELFDPSASTTVEIAYQIVDEAGNVLVEDAGTKTGYVGEEVPTLSADYNNDFVTYTYSPTTTTASTTKVVATAHYNLPFELTADPTDEDNANFYYLTLRGAYCHEQEVGGDVEINNPKYQWAFSGNPVTGIRLYNRFYADYMRVGSTDNYVLVPEITDGTTADFNISRNSQNAKGFNLYAYTNNYINERDGNLSTWKSTAAVSDAGSCLVAYTTEEVVAKLIDNDITPYFSYAGCVNSISYTDALSVYEDYVALVEAPNYDDYVTLKATIEAFDMVQPSESYVMVINAYNGFYNQQGVFKAMYYDTEAGKIRWKTMEQNAPFILKLHEGDAGKFSLSSAYADQYLQTKNGAVTSDAESALTFEVIPSGIGKVALAYNPDGGTDAALHAEGHASGAGISGNLVGWTKEAEVSLWSVMPVELEEITLLAPEGVADGEQIVQGFANSYDAQLPLTVGVYTISEETGVGAHLETIESGQIAASTGYIISGKKGQVVPLLPVTESVAAPENNLLVAGTGSTENGGFILAYKKGEDQAKFWPLIGLTIPENRSYLPEGTSTIGLESIFGGLGEGDLNDVTGINAVGTDSNNAAIYDLQGRRVNKAQKGIFIIGGKKVVK